jgi:hypothetical protein
MPEEILYFSGRTEMRRFLGTVLLYNCFLAILLLVFYLMTITTDPDLPIPTRFSSMRRQGPLIWIPMVLFTFLFGNSLTYGLYVGHVKTLMDRLFFDVPLEGGNFKTKNDCFETIVGRVEQHLTRNGIRFVESPKGPGFERIWQSQRKELFLETCGLALTLERNPVQARIILGPASGPDDPAPLDILRGLKSMLGNALPRE